MLQLIVRKWAVQVWSVLTGSDFTHF